MLRCQGRVSDLATAPPDAATATVVVDTQDGGIRFDDYALQPQAR